VTVAGGSRATLLDRALRAFTDVRPGEGATALLLALNVFLLLTSYSIVKVLREPLILAGGGAEVKAYSAAGQAALLLVLVPAYGALAARVPRRALIAAVTAFFLVCMLGFYAAARLGVPVGVPFYLWVGVFSLMIIAQFWSFANDLYTTEEGKRLFPLIQVGGSIGAVAGSAVAGVLIRPLGLYEPLLLGAALLAAATAITFFVDRRERRRTEEARAAALTSGTLPAATAQYRADTGEFKAVTASEAYAKASGTFRTVKPGADERQEVKATKGAFRLVLHNPYLLAIAVMIVLLNWVNTSGQYIMDRTVQGFSAEDIGRFSAGFQTGVNVLSLLLQLFVVSRVLRYLGVRVALLVLPAIALVGYSVLAFAPVLWLMRWIKTAENATDYSLQNTLRGVWFLPTTREEKYSAKQAIDGFFVRAGDLLHAGLVFAGTTWLAMAPRHFALVNLALVAAWLALAVTVGRRYDRLAAAAAT
jgi:AAA family ATP:ADP antiporter